jgi:CHAT domain-containing protein
VLSACNTIAGDRPGAEALSGLARAFFYAGARALLVSHWAVESNAAMRLTTSTFDILKSDPTLGRGEALRRSMLAYMNDATDPYSAYPALWAPFVVVGECCCAESSRSLHSPRCSGWPRLTRSPPYSPRCSRLTVWRATRS